MRKISDRTARIIQDIYSTGSHIDSNYYVSSNVDYTANNAFSLFFKVDVKESKMDIPSFGMQTILNCIINNLNQHKKIDSIAVPFVSSLRIYKASKSADLLMRALNQVYPNLGEMFVTVKTDKGELYYGAKGLIFDKDMNLLFLTSVECDMDNSKIMYRKAKVYVHPSVFYSDGTIEKCLISKVIPYFLKEGVSVHGGSTSIPIKNCINYDDPDDWRTYHKTIPQIIVADVKDKFFCKPVLSSVTFKDEDINEFLNKNLDAVFDIMNT